MAPIDLAVFHDNGYAREAVPPPIFGFGQLTVNETPVVILVRMSIHSSATHS